MTSSRASVANVFNVAKQKAMETTPAADPNRVQGVAFLNGRYVVSFNDAAYAKLAAANSGRNAQGYQMSLTGGTGIPSPAEMKANPPKDVASLVSTLNRGLDHLVTTAKYDHDVPGSISEMQLREHYVKNVPFPGQDTPQKSQAVGALDEIMRKSSDYFLHAPQQIAAQQAAGGMGITDPRDVESLRSSAAARYNIPDDLSKRLVGQESGGNQSAVSGKGARGVMQLMPATAHDLGVDHFSLEGNIEGGHKYLAQLYYKYKSWPLALAAYNAGPGAVDHYKGVPPYAETQNYVKSITSGLNLGE